MAKPCISSGFMQTSSHPLDQHFSEPEQSSSPCQASTQIPIWSGLGLGQNSGFPSAAGNFNIIFMLIFCYSVLEERFSSLYDWCHFKQEQTCQFCTVVTLIMHNKERLTVTGKKSAHAYNDRVTPNFRAGMLIVKVHTLWFCANMPTAIKAAFCGTFTIAIPKAGLNTWTNLTGSGLGTQTRFFLCCNIINSPFPHFHNAPCLPTKILHKNCFHFLMRRL